MSSALITYGRSARGRLHQNSASTACGTTKNDACTADAAESSESMFPGSKKTRCSSDDGSAPLKSNRSNAPAYVT